MPVVIRRLTRADVPGARRVFRAGMMETITSGGKTQRLAALATATSVLIAEVTWRASGAAPFALGLSFLSFCLIFYGWPLYLARAYVRKSLSDDMLDPVSRYVESSHGGSFWVAYDTGQQRVVGTVGLEPPSENSDPESPWSAADGDVELRRMSVASTHRGQGLSKRLFLALLEHAKSNQFSRIVLSTSEMQGAACKLYPKLGFQTVKTSPLPSVNLPLIKVYYFSRLVAP